MSRRSACWGTLKEAISAQRWPSTREPLYRVLYGLAPNHQLSLARFTMKRHLPRFQAMWPKITWPKELLGDPDAWVQQFRRRVPEEPPRDRPADAHFMFGFDSLLLGTYYRSDPSVVTSSSTRSILEAIEASAADQHSESLDPVDTLKGNRAADVMRSNEWQEVIEWMWTHELPLAPDAPIEQLERDLDTWKQHAMLLIVPDAARLLN
jgi:hypothetical protein